MKNELLNYKDAVDRLDFHLEGKKKRVHTFEGGICLMGCDMDLTKVKRILKEAKPDERCVSGPNMVAMGHGVAVLRNNRWLFISTK